MTTLEAKRTDGMVVLFVYCGQREIARVSLTKDWGLAELYAVLQRAVNHVQQTESLKFNW